MAAQNLDDPTRQFIDNYSQTETTSRTLAGLIASAVTIIKSTPLNTFLSVICIFLIYLIYREATNKQRSSTTRGSQQSLKPFPKGDMTLDELKKYNGESASEGRVLLAINREIYDVTRASQFYGPGGPYAPFAGHDATRALALFKVDAVKETWDDYSDLSVSQMATVFEWIEQFKEKYDYVGRLVRTESEKATPVDASDEEEDEEVEERDANAKAIGDRTDDKNSLFESRARFLKTSN